MTKERVIFRREYDPYMKQWGYIAVFPDDEANPGRVGILPFKETDTGFVYEPYCEANIDYVLSKKIIHKGTAAADKCLEAVMLKYGTEFKVCEKMTRR